MQEKITIYGNYDVLIKEGWTVRELCIEGSKTTLIRNTRTRENAQRKATLSLVNRLVDEWGESPEGVDWLQKAARAKLASIQAENAAAGFPGPRDFLDGRKILADASDPSQRHQALAKARRRIEDRLRKDEGALLRCLLTPED